MLVLIDNFDSFVHNLARYFRRLGQETLVLRNDATTPAEIAALEPAAIVLSPGPCTPSEAGCSLAVVQQLAGHVPMLGVCLGHQAIGAALGGMVVRAPQPMHGRTSAIRHRGQGIFAGLADPLTVGRYHSLVVDAAGLPPDLEVTAETGDGVVMALAHRRWPVFGVQFHPESILTEGGYALLANFLRIAGLSTPASAPSLDQERPPAAPPQPLPAQPVTF
jgi:anthranilate synthase/aminodeoxychorismate synthase-like glutamine amidotransferase